jgi:hypothetical protein
VNRACKSSILSDPQEQRSDTSAFDNSSHLARVEVLGEEPAVIAGFGEAQCIVAICRYESCFYRILRTYPVLDCIHSSRSLLS